MLVLAADQPGSLLGVLLLLGVIGGLVAFSSYAWFPVWRSWWRQRNAEDEPEILPRSAASCPFCREGFSDLEEATIRCSGCEVRHHVECWGEHGGCSVLGCDREAGGRRARGLLPQREGVGLDRGGGVKK